jgi:hypothetical protein
MSKKIKRKKNLSENKENLGMPLAPFGQDFKNYFWS